MIPLDDMSPGQRGKDALDIDHVRANTFIEYAELHSEIDSTNDQALRLSVEPGLQIPALIVAERQTVGRGRGANRWWTSAGGLTFSVAVSHPPTAKLGACAPTSLVAGIAVAETLRRTLPGSEVSVKWPNDVILEQRKVCGILVENSKDDLSRQVIGIGINVNNRIDAAPAEIRSTAISLSDVEGTSFDRSQLLIELLEQLELALRWMQSAEFDLANRWRQFCFLTGKSVELRSGKRQIVGLCEGVDDSGALLLRHAEGVEKCFAGVVASIRD